MAIGWSESEGRCKKHPMNRQSPGVCSSCLRERLGQLSSSKPLKPTSPSSFSSSSYSSCSYSSASSPSSLKLRNREIKNQISSLISREGPLFLQAEKPLVRSRSLVASIKNRVRETRAGDEKKKKGGFWSTLLRSTGKRRKDVALLRSKTVEKKPSSTWVAAVGK